jgi:hypothetical protein
MKTLLQMEMYSVREYTPTYRFLQIINSTLTDGILVLILKTFKNFFLDIF